MTNFFKKGENTMSEYDSCPRCGRIAILSRHKCPPEWLAFCADCMAENEAEPAFGHFAEIAAESYAERGFAGWEYPGKMEIWVKRDGDKDWRKFIVTARAEPVFRCSAPA